MKKLFNQRGMIDIVLIIVVFVLAAGLGGYVYYRQQQNNKAIDSASTGVTVARHAAAPAHTSQTYFTIKEWGVRAPYSGTSTFSYSIKDGQAWITSKQLADADPAHCDHGSNGNDGSIGRYLASDKIPSVTNDGMTAAAYVNQDFKGDNSIPPSYSKVGQYYYIYWTGQAACTDMEAAVNKANSDIESIVSKLQAIPSQ